MNEPKPAFRRLLTVKEIIHLVKSPLTDGELALALIARREQDVMTASIKDAEWANKLREGMAGLGVELDEGLCLPDDLHLALAQIVDKVKCDYT